MSNPENQGRSGLSDDAKALMAFESAKKSACIAYLLWFFFGGLGIHRFYLGRTGSGIAQLVLFIVSLILTFAFIGAFGFIVLGIWVIVDAFLIPGISREHNEALMQRLEAGSGA